ncbi:MAG: hypothetical protein E7505_02160 [Ruminococcus sp.]|nr:hypothetical protein [Ruminococcus sp.]
MKNIKTIAVSAACIAAVMGTTPFNISAESEELIYGTMNIPYADFYAAELAGSVNVYEVDAVSSATKSKWSKNGEGELFEGTYNQANEDGTGTILGVTYPVALTKETLDALGDGNYGFAALDTVPAAYKTVTAEDGKISFSAVQDAAPDVLSDPGAKISTDTAWGDYLLTVDDAVKDMGPILGWILKTENGESYAMRHEENIWRGELAWSAGFVTSEPHGNTLSYEDYVGLMGDTITEMVIITENGYHTAKTSVYVPIKTNATAKAENADIAVGKTPVTVNGFPSDYKITYSVENLTASAADGILTYSDAVPGTYTLTISDAGGVYADVLADFTLTTDKIPAVFNGVDKLVKAEGASDEDFANFLANLTSASVNDTEYKISGKKSVKLISADGTIDFTAASNGTNVFDGSGNYNIVINASGYNTPLKLTITAPAETTAAETVVTTASDTTSGTTTRRPAATSKSGTGSVSASPDTGVEGVAIPAALLSIASAAALVTRKKKD